MALISFTSTTSSGYLQTDHEQVEDALVDGTKDIKTGVITATQAKVPVAISSTSGSYSLVAGDIGSHIAVSATGTITLPDGLDTGFAAVIENTGAAATITLSATTTLNTKGSLTTITSQYGAVTVIHKGSNVWHAFGDLA